VSDPVIDASVAVKWVIEEEGTKEALALRGLALTAPDLLIAECADVLAKRSAAASFRSERRRSLPVFRLAATSIWWRCALTRDRCQDRLGTRLPRLWLGLHRARRSRRAPICDCGHEPGAEGRTSGVGALRRASISLGRRRDLAGAQGITVTARDRGVVTVIRIGVRAASVNGAGSGGGAAPAFLSVSFLMLISILVARKFAPTDLLTADG
jgi:hypothetical protein